MKSLPEIKKKIEIFFYDWIFSIFFYLFIFSKNIFLQNNSNFIKKTFFYFKWTLLLKQ